MKKVLQPEVKEISEFRCDIHNDREACVQLTLAAGYGSKYDLQEIRLDLCDECADNLIHDLKLRFGDVVKLKDIVL